MVIVQSFFIFLILYLLIFLMFHMMEFEKEHYTPKKYELLLLNIAQFFPFGYLIVIIYLGKKYPLFK